MDRKARSAEGRAARSSSLGNPSEAYRGQTIAFRVRNFTTRVGVPPAIEDTT